MKTLKLSQPIEAHGQTLTELELRELNGGDITDCGLPFLAEDDRVDTKAIARYISALAGVPVSSVRSLSPADYFAAMGAVLDFFKDTNLKKS